MRLQSSFNIYSSRIDYNLKELKTLAKGKKFILMVKANAYGHDLALIAKYIEENYTNELFDTFGVACLGEAIYLRKVLNTQRRIFVFSDFELKDSEAVSTMVDYGIVPVVSSIEDLETFLGNKDLKFFPLVLKFNSGMNRLGIDYNDIGQIVTLLKGSGRRELEHLMSHMACSYLPKHELNKRQLENFAAIKSSLQAEGISWKELSFSNSGAIEQSFGVSEGTHVRPGLMFYGPQATMTKEQSWNGKIISDFETIIKWTRQVKAGELVGYGGTRVEKDGSLLMIPLGYGDGILTRIKDFSFKIEGKKAHYIGRVNMDITAIWIDDSDHQKYRGKKFFIWGEGQVSPLTLAKHMGTHPYELFCSVTSRVPRKLLLK